VSSRAWTQRPGPPATAWSRADIATPGGCSHARHTRGYIPRLLGTAVRRASQTCPLCSFDWSHSASCSLTRFAFSARSPFTLYVLGINSSFALHSLSIRSLLSSLVIRSRGCAPRSARTLHRPHSLRSQVNARLRLRRQRQRRRQQQRPR